MSETLIESATSVAFGQIESMLARDGSGQSDAAPARALTATVVAVGPRERLQEAVEPLQQLANSGAIRGILIPQGPWPDAGAQVASNLVVLNGLEDNFIDNAVAALRLSSLPTVIWWRGGPADILANLIKLADRVVLDADPPGPGWQCAVERFERAAFSEVRWTRLTRWRALMAQFFDLPEVQAEAASFTRLCIEASDRAAASLFGAWMKNELQWGDKVTIEIQDSDRPSAIARVSLTGGALDLHLRLAKSRKCVESAASVGQTATSRVVSLGDDSLTALLSEELRIRVARPRVRARPRERRGVMTAARFGVIGLGTMGRNLALNIESRGVPVAVWNLEPEWVDDFLRDHAGQAFVGTKTFESLAAALERPRRILMMIPAGKPVDQTIDRIRPVLDAGRRADRRRQLVVRGYPEARGGTARLRHPFRRLRRVGRRGGRPLRSVDHAGRIGGIVGGDQGRARGDCRPD